MPKVSSLILLDAIEPRILMIRGQRVMIDADLAELYGVTTKALNQAIKRNSARFPVDFVFQLSESEKQEVVTICDHLARIKFSRTSPYAFTEHGAIMAASVLNSPRAVEVSVFVVRAFIKLREFIASNKELAQQLQALERKVGSHDEAIRALVKAINQLMASPTEPKKKGRIGFRMEEGGLPPRQDE
ncbi:MAG: ORF6N domain-containing protein [Gemmatales bacterium]